jgi:hypothetical protein
MNIAILILFPPVGGESRADSENINMIHPELGRAMFIE